MPFPNGDPKPGEPGYTGYIAEENGGIPGKTTSKGKGGTPAPPDGSGQGMHDQVDATGGNTNHDFDHAGDFASNSSGQNFMNDLGKAGNTINDAWNSVNGGYNPNRPVIGDPGQVGNVATGSTSYAMGPDGQPQQQARDWQSGLIQQLQQQASGQGPSLAQMQLQKGTDQNISQAMALGQSQRGAGQAGMLKGIQGQQAGIAQGMANDAGMLRLQEQMQAQNMLGQNLSQMRGQDQGMAGMNMQNNQFNAHENTGTSLANAGFSNTMNNNNADRQAAAREAQAKIDLELEKMRQQNAHDTSVVGFVGGALGGMSMSDENVKTNVADADEALFSFLDNLGAHEYEYKDEKHGEGRRVSPMAQEIEKSELGKQFVFETADGKAVDYGKGLGTMLAATAALHKRLKKGGL